MKDLATTEAIRPLRIFLVENHPDTLKYLRMYLEQMGHVVESVQTMREALSQIPESDCDVLISDIGLPDGDGWELMRTASFPGPIYGIAMSGFGLGADRLKSRSAGYRHHVVKPFNPEDLDSLLEEASNEIWAREHPVGGGHSR
jgi:CheY-like chemotaxis protein